MKESVTKIQSYEPEIQFGSWDHMLLRTKNVFCKCQKNLKKETYMDSLSHSNATCKVLWGKLKHFDLCKKKKKQVECQMLHLILFYFTDEALQSRFA